MLLNLDTWIYSKLNANATLANKMHYFYPNSFYTLPIIAYSTEQTATDMDYQDDVNNYVDCRVSLDVYTKNDVDDFTLCQAIDTVLTGLFFSLAVMVPVPDPESKTQHRHLEYTRLGISSGDLV